MEIKYLRKWQVKQIISYISEEEKKNIQRIWYGFKGIIQASTLILYDHDVCASLECPVLIRSCYIDYDLDNSVGISLTLS